MLISKRVLITGGGRGIGKAIATKFAQQGARIAICSRNIARLEATARSLAPFAEEILPIELDITDKLQVQTTINTLRERWDGLDILINNAGMSGMNPIVEEDDTRWYQIIETNLTGMYLVTKAALPIMPTHQNGRVINLSSVLGKFGVEGYTVYCTSKHGIIGFTRALAKEVIGRGITVNALCPGWTDTEMAQKGIQELSEKLNISADQFRQQALAQVPLGRMIDPMEVAELVLYIASEAAQGMTGQAINLCGGATTN